MIRGAIYSFNQPGVELSFKRRNFILKFLLKFFHGNRYIRHWS